MAKMNKGLMYGLIGIATIGLLTLFRKGATLTRIKWYGKSFKLTGGKLYYKVEVINPSSGSITLNNIFLDFYVANFLIGKIFFNTTTNIPSNSKVDLNLPIDIATGGIALLIADITKNLYEGVSIRVTGSVKADNIAIPVDEKIALNYKDYIP